MSDLRFEYDESVLASCASSLNGEDLERNAAETGGIIVNPACWSLFQQHAKHYGREPMNYDQASESRFSNFLKSVRMVHEHTAASQRQRSLHQVSLNQFADGGPGFPTANSNLHDWFQMWNDEDWETQTVREERMTVFRLHNDESIQKAIKLHRQHHGGASTYSYTDKNDDENNRRQLHGKPDDHHLPLHSSFVKDSSPLEFAPDESYSVTNHKELNPLQKEQGNSFETHLNWATHDNPDGVPIVHKAIDQGVCGSCWAFAATGTMEASASRRVAFQAYTAALAAHKGDSSRNLRKHKKKKTNGSMSINEVTYARAVVVAQEAEHEAIKVADLSVQELVDCDTWADQGCTGGNPLLAFYFVHRYGLTSTKLYPYVGLQDECHVGRVAKSIATVQSWGVLTPNHEDNMAHVLLNIGPVAVAVNGADPAFLAYSGGIFESPDCDQLPNHALLIVGYGEELNKDGILVKYWIARNSWGEGWGEHNGYVRIKRGSGKKGVEGVCGIARSPSVALGGTLLPQSGVGTTSVMNEVDSHVVDQPGLETSFVHRYCETSIGQGHAAICNRFKVFIQSHHVLVYCCVSFLVGALVVFPLTKDCRLRRRRRQRHQHRAEEIARRSFLEHTSIGSDSESTPLAHSGRPADTYGARANAAL